MSEANPTIVVEGFHYSHSGDDIAYRVVRDDLLLGGTKQRGLARLVNAVDAEEFVYAGPDTGYAQVALALACKLAKKKATMFIEAPDDGKETLATELARRLGCTINIVKQHHLYFVETAAKRYVDVNPGAYLLPFGLNEESFISALTESIREAWPQDEPEPKRLWSTVGSGALLQTFHRLWPNCTFCIVQVGKPVNTSVHPWLKSLKYEFYESPVKFTEPAPILPPYNSLSTYDAKVWHFFTKNGQSGDVIWNVAGEVDALAPTKDLFHTPSKTRTQIFDLKCMSVDMYEQEYGVVLDPHRHRDNRRLSDDILDSKNHQDALDLVNYYQTTLEMVGDTVSLHLTSLKELSKSQPEFEAIFEEARSRFDGLKQHLLNEQLRLAEHLASSPSKKVRETAVDIVITNRLVSMIVPNNQIDISKVDAKKLLSKYDQRDIESNFCRLIENRVIQFPFKRYFMAHPTTLFPQLLEYKPLVQEAQAWPMDYKFPYGVFRPELKHLISRNSDYDIDVITDYFQEEERLKAQKRVKGHLNESLLDAWTHRENTKILFNRLKGNAIDSHILRETIYSTFGGKLECTQFKPTLAKTIIEMLNGKRVLDFSAGWGDRLVGAIAANVDRYLATDPNRNLETGHNAILSMLCPSEKRNQFEVIYSPFETAILPDETFNLVFTSPPFFDLEIYTHDEGQSTMTFTGYEQWMVGFLFTSLKKAWQVLEINGHLAIHISDTAERKGCCDMMNLFMQLYCEGAKYVGIYASVQEQKNIPRPIFVWKKVVPTEELDKQRLAIKKASQFPVVVQHLLQNSDFVPLSTPLSFGMATSADNIFPSPPRLKRKLEEMTSSPGEPNMEPKAKRAKLGDLDQPDQEPHQQVAPAPTVLPHVSDEKDAPQKLARYNLGDEEETLGEVRGKKRMSGVSNNDGLPPSKKLKTSETDDS